MSEQPTPIRRLPKVIEASCWNRARLALRRLPRPLYLPLAGLRGLEVILEEDCWMCVDRNLGDHPILAWKEFAARGRSALDAPVPCMLHLYHCHAGLIMGSALEALESALEERLNQMAESADG